MASNLFVVDKGVQTGNVVINGTNNTITGLGNVAINGTNNTITGLATTGYPLNPGDAATKTYVDTSITNVLTNGTNSITIGSSNILINANNTAVITVSASGTILAGHTTIEGVTSTGATGTGKLVFSASPTFTGTATFNAITANGLVAATNPQILGASTQNSSGSTVTLTASSSAIQQFNGTANTTVVLPVVSTLFTNYRIRIINGGTGTITVQSSGLNTITTVPSAYIYDFYVVTTSGTGAASWQSFSEGTVNGVSIPTQPGTFTTLTASGSSSLQAVTATTLTASGSSSLQAVTATTLTATTLSATTTQLTALGVGTAPQTTGTIYATGNIYAGYSDIRLKTQTGTIDNALERIVSLSGILYTPNTLAQQFGFNDSAVQVGLVAQDVQKILPEAVSIAPFDIVDGKSKSGENYLTVNYERLVPLLIEAIKELKQEIDNLKNR